ncbi:MAG: C69 family dipeptidase [Thermoanaerobaculia bacterium]|nr:C69 family dipeptidase [Thermoanaerobaculia bacterium]
MRKLTRVALAAATVALSGWAGEAARACTNVLVTKGASADGSTMITYACDGRFHARLRRSDAADHPEGAKLTLRSWGGKVRGEIPQVAHTYAVVGLMNEHQLAISETTTTGREELTDPDGLLHYFDLMQLALERARTAREAIDVMTSLVAAHGYQSTGESFSIADPNEVWLMEMIGKGPGRRGAVWVALRLPEGTISAYANGMRIRELPPADPDWARYSPDVVDFAAEKGYFDPAAGRPFDFAAAYDAPTVQSRRYTATRVWSIFRRAAPSQAESFDPAFHRGEAGATPYPLWIRPDRKLALADVVALMRDHYEGTPYDMTTGLDAGPYGTPNRWRPIAWEVDGEKHSWERPISTPQTGFSFVSQSRSWLPDPIGGVYWYGVDDTWTTCYVPLYAGIDRLPPSFTLGALDRFSWESAWWVFNLVANFANLKFSVMAPEILAVQRELEGHLLALQPAVEKVAAELWATDPALARRYLTDYSVSHGEEVVRRWRELAEALFTRHNDGYVAEEGQDPERGYPEEWLREVVRRQGDRHRLVQPEKAATELPY